MCYHHCHHHRQHYHHHHHHHYHYQHYHRLDEILPHGPSIAEDIADQTQTQTQNNIADVTNAIPKLLISVSA